MSPKAADEAVKKYFRKAFPRHIQNDYHNAPTNIAALEFPFDTG
jgi:hypothetical protein